MDTELVIFPNNRGSQCFFPFHCIMFFDMLQVFLATTDSHKRWDQYLILVSLWPSLAPGEWTGSFGVQAKRLWNILLFLHDLKFVCMISVFCSHTQTWLLYQISSQEKTFLVIILAETLGCFLWFWQGFALRNINGATLCVLGRSWLTFVTVLDAALGSFSQLMAVIAFLGFSH